MDNVNGALAFKATLDINDFNVSAQAMERNIRQVSSTAVSESERMDSSIQSFAQNGARYIVSYLVGQGMGSLLQSIVQTRGQFQQLEIAFSTMLKSGTQAKVLMNQLIDTAAKTPFDLTGIASSAKQMLAYGSTVDNVVDELVMLGNVASGVGAPLQDIAYLYGTLRTQGRAYTVDIRQFAGRGIPIYDELAKVLGVTKDKVSELVTEGKVGFPEVEKAFQNMTSSAGVYYNLMQEQSKSLTGMISNMGDAWEQSLNSLGEANQDIFAGAIESATYMAEHLDDIVRIVKAITIAYGSYKAAIVLNTLVTKGYTGVALLDNTARQAKIALMKTDAVITGQIAAQTKTMTAAQEAHIASLQKQLTVEELANVQKQLRIATIQGLLTAQQQEYLSNLNVTASSANYEAVAMGVLSTEQRLSLSKLDMTAKSAVYRAALEQEVLTKNQGNAATLNAMRTEVKAAAVKMESARADALAAKAAVERAYLEVYRAQQTGNAEKIAIATKKMEGAEDNAALARKTALAAQSDFYAKKKLLEATATKQSTIASVTDTTAKTAQGTATTILTAITTKATLAMKTLWASMMSNPIGWVLGLVGALVTALTLFRSKEEEATDAMGEFQDTTKKEIDNLDLLFAVLQNTEKGTRTHKDTISKVNAICKEYNRTLLDENATLDLQRAKYEELTIAIQQTTAEKIKAKYVEQEMQEYLNGSNDNFNKFKDRLNYASYNTGKTRTVTNYELGETYDIPIMEASENIRKMGEQVKDAIRSVIEDNTKSLASLTGDAFTTKYNEVVKSIMNSTQSATKATNAEMTGVKPIIENYLNAQIERYRVMNSAIQEVDNSISSFYGKDTKPIVESTDYVTMSFDELDKKINETQRSIDILNAKKVMVEADTTKLKELKDLLDKLTGAREAKTTNLNTEKGISDRIKSLKEERSNVEINGKRYKELTATINTLEKKMPKHTTSDKQDNNAESLRQKQLEAERKLEADRIAVMEDGYDKRKATLELQHKQALAQIDKEERELSKARKAAGKGEPTPSEQSGFDERRTLENKSYEKSKNKLFDGEIEYKKQQYELYFRWVRNMGEDVANKQFSKLLAGGNSYKEYVENQIKELQKKKESGSITEGESNQLISLNIQYNEITGAKSAMDAFKESVTKTISQAQTLAEKIEAVAKAKERLSNGSSGLVGADEKAEAILFLSQEEQKNNEELEETLISKYRTYEEQRKSIQEEYAILRNEAMKMYNQERVNLVNQGEADALSALNAQMLMQTESWKNLFSDMDSLTVEQIDKLISEIQTKMNTADLKLNPADLKAVLDKLDEAKRKVLDVNPFKALGSALSDVFKKQEKGSKKTSKQIKTDWSNLANATEGCFDFVNDAIDSCDVLGNLIGDNGKATIQMIQGVATAGIAMGAAIKTAEKSSVILAAISIALQAIQWIAGLFNNDDELEERIQNIQKDIDSLSDSFDRLQHAAEQTYWVYSDEEAGAHNKRVQAIKDEIAALEQQAVVARNSWNFVKYAQLTKQIKELKYALEKEESNGDMFQLFELQKSNLREQQELIKQQIAAEKDKKDTDWGKIQEWEEAIKDIDTQIEDMEKGMLETLAGTDIKTAIDDFADALVDAYCQGEDAAEALGETTKNVLKKAVVEALKRQFLAKAINDAILYLGDAMKDGELSSSEKSKFEAMVNAAGDTFNAALEGIGDWIKDIEDETETDPLTGAVTSMSEETGGVIAGRLNAFIINQSDQIMIMRQTLVYQAEIAANTKSSASELTEIKATLKRIENKDNSLLSQGIS